MGTMHPAARGPRPRHGLGALAHVLGLVLLMVAAPARAGENASKEDLSPASGPSGLAWAVSLDGLTPDSIRSGDPLSIGPEEPLLVELSLRNDGDEPILVRSVRLQGRVMGMVFFRYTVVVGVELQPGQPFAQSIELELDDLAEQAVGLLPADLMLLDDDGAILAEEALDVEVEGSLWSAYGVFGIAVAAMTVVLLATLLLGVWRSAVHENRWKRGLQFATPGFGLGLTITFTLSASGLLVPSAGAWLPLVGGFTALAFALGYVLPLGVAEDEDEDGSLVDERVEESSAGDGPT